MSVEGLLYIATGTQYLEEAATNTRAGRPHVGSRPIAVITDDVESAEHMQCFDACFTHPDPRRSFRDKIPALLDLPFERTIFLDSDARIIAPVDGMFSLLDNQDAAAAHAPVRIPSGWSDPTVPEVFPELNSGVLLLKRCDRQAMLIRRWLELYDEVGQDWDQATFRSAAWAMISEGLELGVLPPEANLRTTKPWVAGKGLPVTIVHGRVPEKEWPALVEYLNGDIDRFRTSADWTNEQPETTLTPRVAPSRRGIRTPADEMSKHLTSISSRWTVDVDEPLPCENPIFILAAGWRSGSTLLQRMLVADPELMIWGEPHDRAQIIQGLCAQWLPFTANWPNESHQAPLDPAEELTESWLANRSPSATALRQAHRLFFDRLFGEPARQAGRTRWGLKEVRLDASHAMYLRWLFPASRILLLVRNPFDAYASYKQRGPWFFEWPKEPVQGVAAYGEIWSRLATQFHELSSNSQCMLLRYEDLEESVHSLREHTGLSTVAAPSELSVQRGQAKITKSGKVNVLERTRLTAATRNARDLLGY